MTTEPTDRYTFEHILNDNQIASLVDCVNEVRMFKGEEVTFEQLKESGSIEYSSDIVIGLQLKGAGKKTFDPTAEKKKDPREIELVILKNRQGSVGDKVALSYYPMFNYFTDGGLSKD